ncbi:MAG: hypothetical protein ACFFAQ_04450 [Promethearchaeota archaeon]
MNLFNSTNFGKNSRRNQQTLKKIFCLFFLIIIIFSFIDIKEIFTVSSNFDSPSDIQNTFDTTPNLATDTSMLQDPFTKNFDGIQQFFESKYKSDLDLRIDLYFRYGDNSGNIVDDTIFSEDNLLLYKSLMGTDLSHIEIYEKYLDLKSTPLWYEESLNQFQYGFMRSFDNTTETIKDDNRYLIDNLMPVFLLIDSIGTDMKNININGDTPIGSIVEIFNLINSSEFWDSTNFGFNYRNSTADVKYTKYNLYGVLANLYIHRLFGELGEESEIKDRAYEDLAIPTMAKLIVNMWDAPLYLGFYYNATGSWNTGGAFAKDKYLDVNALGIITLLEYWVETGKKNDSSYLQKAIYLYNKLDEKLWVSGPAYMYKADRDWSNADPEYNLEANSIMMSACLKLFELTGNITYYNRAIEIFDYFENNLYDGPLNKAYDSSNSDPSKNLHSNLKLSEAYLNAFEIYNSTNLRSVYNVSDDVPNFIFFQDRMNLTTTYSFEKLMLYYNPVNSSFAPTKIRYDIINADIHYLFKYPNGTFFKQFEYPSNPDTSHTLLYDIPETLSIGNGYNIYVWANTTYFSFAEIIKTFNVNSGLVNYTIKGMVGTLYQGLVLNVTVPINNTRNEDVTLSTILEGEQINNYPTQIINFTSFEITEVSFNLTAKFGAVLGSTEIHFKFIKGNNIYLEITKIIEIGHSFAYEGFMYDGKIVSGDKISVGMNLVNFLPNATQSLNVSFMGEFIDDFISEEYLAERQIKTVHYELNSSENIIYDTIDIEMSITINKTTYYTETMVIEILPIYEIISVSFPDKVSQGSTVYFILIIKNNREESEVFSLYVNNKKSSTNINQLAPGDNRIVKKITLPFDPYDFGSKTYSFLLEDSSGESIALFYFEVTIELSTFNLIIFYILPIIVPIGIILYFKNKDIKVKKLRR